MDSPLEQLSEAFDNIGHPMYSNEHLGRVLAWACLSGFCEACVLNPVLYTVIRIAQKRFKIEGGMRPDMAAMEKHWRPAMTELAKHGVKTPWLQPLMERYKIVGWEKLNYREWMPEFERRHI